MNSIVIGSGFGGIAAALRLKAKGHKVTLIEKHGDLGGRARVFQKNGFIYDGGPTVITAPYLINELFELFQKKPDDYIKLTPLKVWYQFIFEDKSKFNYSGLSLSSNSRSTKKTAEPAQLSFLLIPPPITATYRSELISPPSVDGILTILGVDQVSPNCV